MESKFRKPFGSVCNACGLTARELAVITLAAEGKPRGEVANILNISIDTVHTHLKSIYRKLNVNNLTRAVRKLEECCSKQGVVNVFC